MLSKNNYNKDFIQRNTHRPTTTTETNDNTTPTTTATIPYIKGISENISRILQPFNIRVAQKPITTIRQLLTNVTDKDEPRNRQGAVCKINCSDCRASYIGETGRNLTTRLTEHKRAARRVISLLMRLKKQFDNLIEKLYFCCWIFQNTMRLSVILTRTTVVASQLKSWEH